MKYRSRMIKVSALALGIIMLISSLGLSATAAGKTAVGDITTGADSEYLFTNYSNAVSDIYEAIAKHQTGEIDIYKYKIPIEYARSLVTAVKSCFPELCYLDNCSYWTYGDGYVLSVKPIYVDGDNEAMKNKFLEVADERYLSLIDDSMDDFTKAVILHDALVLNTYYPEDYQTNRGNNYTYMVEGYGVCEYYSRCYAYLLAQCGIKSEYLSSNSMNHAWLKIQLDGKWYHVDSTWDDPIPDRVGRASHNYFLYSDTAFQNASATAGGRAHTGYSSAKSSDSKYDSFSNLHNIKSQLCYLDGVFYAITSDSKLVTYDRTTDKINALKNLNFYWSAGSNSYWGGNYSSLAEYNGKLYYNGPSAVYEYDPATGSTSKYADADPSESNDLYGIRIIDGKLFGVYAENPNVGNIAPTYMTDMPSVSHSVAVSDNIVHGTVSADKETAFAGESVTLSVTPDDGYQIGAVWVDNTEVLSDAAGAYTFEMPDHNVNVAAEFVFADGIGAKLAGYTLSLDGDIGVNFYMEIAEETAADKNAYMLFKIPNSGKYTEKTVSVSEADIKQLGDSTYYVFKCSVSAKEMCSEIKARIIDGEMMGTEYTYSVKDYAEFMLSHQEIEEYAEAADLVKSMLKYGTYSQKYFFDVNAEFANDILDESDRKLEAITAGTINKSVFFENMPDDVTFDGATLSLQSETTLSLYFTSDEKLEFECGRDTEVESDGKYQILRIRNINAKELGDDFDVTVSAGENSGTVTYSPMNYCYNVLNRDGNEEKLVNVVKALYSYWRAAKLYFNYNPEA